MAGVIEQLTAANGTDGPGTLMLRGARADYLDDLDRRVESEAEWRALAEAQGRVFGSDHADAVYARDKIAVALYGQRRLQDSAAERSEVIALRNATVGADHVDTKRARDWLTAVRREPGEPDQARTP